MAFADNGEFNQSFSEQSWDIYKGPLYTRVKDRLTWLLNIVQWSGFTIEFFNSSGTSIDRTFDFFAKGVGKIIT